MIKAGNLTISIPVNGKCNKNCPYCISKMTGYIEHNDFLMKRNIYKVIELAKNANITSVLFTSKKEPLMNLESVMDYAYFFKNYPLEIQTNGIELCKDDIRTDFILKKLSTYFDIIAISVDSNKQLKDLEKYKVYSKIKKYGMSIRLCLNINTMLDINVDYINYCNQHNIDQLLYRQLTYPSTIKNHPWINEYANSDIFQSFYKKLTNKINISGFLYRMTGDNIYLYDVDGTSVGISEECLQETNKSTDIRSLIFLEDGHLYTSWNSFASKIF